MNNQQGVTNSDIIESSDDYKRIWLEQNYPDLEQKKVSDNKEQGIPSEIDKNLANSYILR